MTMNLLPLETHKSKAIYVVALPALRDAALSLLSGIRLVSTVDEADAVWVLDAGEWPNDATVLAGINKAQRLGKPWVLLRFGLRDLFQTSKPKTPTRRRVTLPK